MSKLGSRVFESVLRKICRFLFRVRVHQYGALPKEGKFLVVANHASILDGLLLGLFLPFRPVFVVHSDVLKTWVFRFILSHTAYLVLDKLSPFAMKKAVKLLNTGHSVMLFPEGRVTMTGGLMKIYEGAGFIAAKTGAAILPVGISGAENSYFSYMPAHYPRQFFPKISLTIFAPEYIQASDASDSKLSRKQVDRAMRRLMQNMMFQMRPTNTLFSALLEVVAQYGRRREAVEDGHASLSYGQLLKKSLILGRQVSTLSQPGERIGVLLPNVSATLCAIFGMSAMSRVPVMLDYTTHVRYIEDACVIAKVRTVLTSRAFLHSDALIGMADSLKHVSLVYLEDLGQQEKKESLCDRLWKSVFQKVCKGVCKGVPDDPALVLFKPSLVGEEPKAVVLSHRAILSNIAQIRSVIDVSASDKFLVALPLFQAFGLTCGGMMALLSGAKLLLRPHALEQAWLIPETVYDRSCTILLGTNDMLAHYAKFAHSYDFYTLRYVFAGGKGLDVEVRQNWMEQFGIRILEGYGATECAPVIAMNTPQAYRSGTVGLLLPGIEYRIVKALSVARGGVLHVRGPNIQPPMSEIGNGWYNTGDTVEVDEDGFICLLGSALRFGNGIKRLN